MHPGARRRATPSPPPCDFILPLILHVSPFGGSSLPVQFIRNASSKYQWRCPVTHLDVLLENDLSILLAGRMSHEQFLAPLF